MPPKPPHQTIIQTEFDERTIGRSTQLLKALIPFLEPSQQKMFGLMVRIIEFNMTVDFFNHNRIPACAFKPPCGGDMLSELKCYCSPDEQKQLDMMIGMIKAQKIQAALAANPCAPPPGRPPADKPPGPPPHGKPPCDCKPGTAPGKPPCDGKPGSPPGKPPCDCKPGSPPHDKPPCDGKPGSPPHDKPPCDCKPNSPPGRPPCDCKPGSPPHGNPPGEGNPDKNPDRCPPPRPPYQPSPVDMLSGFLSPEQLAMCRKFEDLL